MCKASDHTQSLHLLLRGRARLAGNDGCVQVEGGATRPRRCPIRPAHVVVLRVAVHVVPRRRARSPVAVPGRWAVDKREDARLSMHTQASHAAEVDVDSTAKQSRADGGLLACMHACIHASVRACMHTRMRARSSRHAHKRTQEHHSIMKSTTCMHASTRACMHTRVCACMCTHARTHVRRHVQAHTPVRHPLTICHSTGRPCGAACRVGSCCAPCCPVAAAAGRGHPQRRAAAGAPCVGGSSPCAGPCWLGWTALTEVFKCDAGNLVGNFARLALNCPLSEVEGPTQQSRGAAIRGAERGGACSRVRAAVFRCSCLHALWIEGHHPRVHPYQHAGQPQGGARSSTPRCALRLHACKHAHASRLHAGRSPLHWAWHAPMLS